MFGLYISVLAPRPITSDVCPSARGIARQNTICRSVNCTTYHGEKGPSDRSPLRPVKPGREDCPAAAFQNEICKSRVVLRSRASSLHGGRRSKSRKSRRRMRTAWWVSNSSRWFCGATRRGLRGVSDCREAPSAKPRSPYSGSVATSFYILFFIIFLFYYNILFLPRT